MFQDTHCGDKHIDLSQTIKAISGTIQNINSKIPPNTSTILDVRGVLWIMAQMV